MPALDDDVFSASPAKSRFLSPGSSSPRKSPSRQSVKTVRSTASLRGSSLIPPPDDDAANGRHSLAHELAVALMPEPSAGSKLLAEEFGIEYDEGAEGIDETPQVPQDGPSFADELGTEHPDILDGDVSLSFDAEPPLRDVESPFATPARRKQPERDAMDILASDIESTDKFLAHLRRLDADVGTSASEPQLEKITLDMIRRINETARDREGQLRELLGYEREFRRIAGEVGGSDVLGLLDELEDVEGLSSGSGSGSGAHAPEATSHSADGRSLDTVQEDASISHSQSLNDWETDPDRNRLGDDEVEDEDEEQDPDTPTPAKDAFPAAPPLPPDATPGQTLPQLAHMRTLTSSLVSSLMAISEHAQVNGAATAEAGRKIRALKNKLGGWRTDWDSAERSRVRIEKWEAGERDEAMGVGTTPRVNGVKRVDGRRLVEEQLREFERALAEAGTKTQAIMSAA